MNLGARSPRPAAIAARYEVVLGGRLGERSARWFDGFEITECKDSTTRLTGFVRDQAALFGLLNRIRDLNLPLLSLRRLDAGGNSASV